MDTEHYLHANMNIDGDITIEGWRLRDQYWNGFVIPVFPKASADKIAKEFLLTYDEATDTYNEYEDPHANGTNGEIIDTYTGFFVPELNTTVYAIGASSWIWDDDLREEK